jgi:hypothetical protein
LLNSSAFSASIGAPPVTVTPASDADTCDRLMALIWSFKGLPAV